MLIIFLINSSVRIDLGSIRRSCLCPVMSHTPYCTAVECQDRFIHALLIWHCLLTSYLLVHAQYSHLQDPTEQLHGSQACSHIRTYTVSVSQIKCEMQSAMPDVLYGWKHRSNMLTSQSLSISIYIHIYIQYTHWWCIVYALWQPDLFTFHITCVAIKLYLLNLNFILHSKQAINSKSSALEACSKMRFAMLNDI